MTDRELLDRKGHEVNDDLPPLPEPAYLADDMHAFPAGTVAKWPQPNRDRMAHPLYTAAQVEEIRRAAVLAERERCAKGCEADPDAVFSAIWKSLVIPGEFDAMDETDKNRWRGVIMLAIGLTTEKCAAAIRGVKT